MSKYSDNYVQGISGLETSGDTHQLLAAMNIIRMAARKIALPIFYGAENIPTRIKANKTPVTIADELMEADLTKELKPVFPGARILGEEAVSALLADPFMQGREQRLRQHDSLKKILTIDPIDGTTLFKARQPGWCPMISLIEDAKPILAIIYDPVVDEFLIASEDINGTHRVKRNADSSFMAEKVTIPQIEMSKMKFFFHNRKDDHPSGESFLGGASHAFGGGSEEISCMSKATRLIVTEGTCCFAIINHEIRTGIWDYAPAAYIVENAGGYACRIDGTAPKLTNEMDSIVLAPRREVAEFIVRAHASLVK